MVMYVPSLRSSALPLSLTAMPVLQFALSGPDKYLAQINYMPVLQVAIFGADKYLAQINYMGNKILKIHRCVEFILRGC